MNNQMQIDAEIIKSSERTMSESMAMVLGRQVSKIVPLDRHQNRELAFRVRAGDKQAREEMITGNMALAWRSARRWRYLDLPQEDAVQTAYEKLVHCVDKFDPNQGFTFSTYCIGAMKMSMRRELLPQSNGQLRLPSHLEAPMFRFKYAELALIGRGELITMQGLIKEMDKQMAPDAAGRDYHCAKVINQLRTHLSHALTSLDVSYTDDGGDPLVETIGSQIDDIYELERRIDAKRALNTMTAGQRLAVALNFGIECDDNRHGRAVPLHELAEQLDCSRQNLDSKIKNSLKRACKKLGLEKPKQSQRSLDASKRMKDVYAGGFDPLGDNRGKRK